MYPDEALFLSSAIYVQKAARICADAVIELWQSTQIPGSMIVPSQQASDLLHHKEEES